MGWKNIAIVHPQGRLFSSSLNKRSETDSGFFSVAGVPATLESNRHRACLGLILAAVLLGFMGIVSLSLLNKHNLIANSLALKISLPSSIFLSLSSDYVVCVYLLGLDNTQSLFLYILTGCGFLW